ncbi:hypothetical protein LINPERHAP1_LOCUS8220 [Linum perenne]
MTDAKYSSYKKSQSTKPTHLCITPLRRSLSPEVKPSPRRRSLCRSTRHRSDAAAGTPPPPRRRSDATPHTPPPLSSPVRSYVVQSPLLGAPTQASVLVLRSLQVDTQSEALKAYCSLLLLLTR